MSTFSPTCERQASILVLALGNDILGDDGVGFLAARALRGEFGKSQIEFVESGEAGLALIELMEGYDRALLLDAAVTGKHVVGTVITFSPADFKTVAAPSPHYAGLPEVLQMAERLRLHFPAEIEILALEVEDPYTIRESLTPVVEAALPAYVARAREILQRWI